MSRRKSQEQLDHEAEEADRLASERARAQAECTHYNCRPTEWHWNGTPREMLCEECGATNYLEDEH